MGLRVVQTRGSVLRSFRLRVVSNAVAALSALSVTGCLGNSSATGSPNGSSPAPVVLSASSPIGSSGAGALPTSFSVTLNWQQNHEAVMQTTNGYYWVQINYSPNGSGPGSLATSANGALPLGMQNPFKVQYGMAGTTVTTGVVCTINVNPTCTIHGLLKFSPAVYSFYVQACANTGCGSAPSQIPNSLAQISPWPLSPTNLSVTQ